MSSSDTNVGTERKASKKLSAEDNNEADEIPLPPQGGTFIDDKGSSKLGFSGDTTKIPKKFQDLADGTKAEGRSSDSGGDSRARQEMAAIFKKRDKVVKKIEVEPEVEEVIEEVPLINRRDSELSPAQIVEKDIVLYDMLMEDEQLMEMTKDQAPKEPVYEVTEFDAHEDEEEEEEDEEEEEEIEEEIEPEEELPPEPELSMPEEEDDHDNLVNLMIQQAAEEDEDETETLFMGDLEGAMQAGEGEIEGIVGIGLSEQTRTYFKVDDHLAADPNVKHIWLSKKRLKLHIHTFAETSEFHPYYEQIKYYPDMEMLLGIDAAKQSGEDFYFCLSIEARNRVLNPPKRRKHFVDLKKKEEEVWNEMSSIAPRKWKGFGSEKEVDDEKEKESRPPITIQVSRYRRLFGQDYTFEDAPLRYECLEVDPAAGDATEFIECREVDRGIQVMPQKQVSATQTDYSFKRNKSVQHMTQKLTEKKVEKYMNSKKMTKFFHRVLKPLEKVLQQNEMVDLLFNDYKCLKAQRGHEIEFSTESTLLQEYQTYTDFRHTKDRTVTCMTFHPTLDDIVVMSVAEDCTFDKRIDAHSKTLMEPNFVLFWDLRDSSHPQLMLDAPSDVFAFMINPSDPNLVCGGCANGQVVLWDLGRSYFDLRSSMQDRRKKSDPNSRRPSFLEKLKDSAEKYSCPLIPVSGLSNLDLSHKRIITSVCWLPPHVEVGKNGMMYENSMGNKSSQFFSIAGDNSLRLWDIRAHKAGMDDYEDGENQPKNVFKSNPWAHLDNNQWKYVLKYALDDGSGNMYATLMSLSECKPAEKAIDPNEIKRLTLHHTHSDDFAGASRTELEDGNTKRTAVLKHAPQAQTSIFIGTEIGQICFVDWLRNKDGSINPDSGNKVCQSLYVQCFHDGAITSISRSPFYTDLLLVVGGGSVSIWKEKSPYPILQVCGSDIFPWCGTWSNSRPAVFFVGTREGAVQVWDLLDRSNGPVMSQQVTNCRITTISLPKLPAAGTKKPFLAVGDSEGCLYVLVLPRFYAKPQPTEDLTMTELMHREDKRMTDWVAEQETRTEKLQAVNALWKASMKSKTQKEIDEEEVQQEARLDQEYTEFLEFEAKTVSKLKRDEPSLPTEEMDIATEYDELLNAAQAQDEDDDTDVFTPTGSQFFD